jgi:hypothetical protein
VSDAEIDLCDNEETVLQQQIVVAMNASAKTVLYGNQSPVGFPLDHRLEGILEAFACKRLADSHISTCLASMRQLRHQSARLTPSSRDP